MVRTRFSGAWALVLVIAAAVPASAAYDIKADYRGTINGSNSLIGKYNLAGGSPASQNVYVDQLKWDVLEDNNNLFDQTRLNTFCIELDDAVRDPSWYEVRNASEVVTSGRLTSAKVDNLKRLVNAALSTGNLTDLPAFTFDSRESSAAFQAAVWNLLYDSDLTASTGTFFMSSFSTAALTRANDWMAGLSGQSTSLGGYSLAFLIGDATRTPNGQDQFTLVPTAGFGAPVPEPTSLAVWGLLSVGAGGIARRRRRKALLV